MRVLYLHIFESAPVALYNKIKRLWKTNGNQMNQCTIFWVKIRLYFVHTFWGLFCFYSGHENVTCRMKTMPHWQLTSPSFVVCVLFNLDATMQEPHEQMAIYLSLSLLLLLIKCMCTCTCVLGLLAVSDFTKPLYACCTNLWPVLSDNKFKPFKIIFLK